jgi:imidazolonepropionase-like amidohydrolase
LCLALSHLSDAGTVPEGKSGDVLMLDANPLDYITNTGHIAGVYLRGSKVD